MLSAWPRAGMAPLVDRWQLHSSVYCVLVRRTSASEPGCDHVVAVVTHIPVRHATRYTSHASKYYVLITLSTGEQIK